MKNHPTEESIESTVKSIAKKEELNFVFGDFSADFNDLNWHHFSSNKINLPKIENASKSRAVADLAALYLAYHNSKIHQKYYFDLNEKQKLFDDLEKVRLVILGAREYAGIKLNVQNFVENEITKISEIWEIALLFLKRAIGILNNIEVANFKPEVIEFLDVLNNKIINQQDFAEISAEFINKIPNKNQKPDNEENGFESFSSAKQVSTNNPQPEADNFPQNKREAEILNKEISSKDEVEKDKNAIFEESEEVFTDKGLSPNLALGSKSLEFISPYKIFTKKYDVIAKSSDLASKEELEKLRKSLDLKMKDLKKISSKSKTKLKRKLLSEKLLFNEYNKEEGSIDPKKLNRLIINPAKKDNYLQIKDTNYQDTMISFLIDNSGSMRGMPINMSIMACEIIVQILEKFGIKTEILGFTTDKWHGGKSKQLWQMSGSKPNPGRLSDLLHIIYKNSNQSLKQARLNLALMLKEGILKENIDGEALLWAARRLNNYPENRKILIVISDGAPIDDSTNSNNDKNILIDHLHHSISVLTRKSNIELAAIGIGHDVANFYQNSITIKNAEDLGDSLITEICSLL